MNCQSPQAIQSFHGEQDDELSTTEYPVCPIYGPFAALKSTGQNPLNKFIIRPLTKEIRELARLVLTLIKPNESLVLFKPQFNFWEIKIYLGDNMLNIRGCQLTIATQS